MRVEADLWKLLFYCWENESSSSISLLFITFYIISVNKNSKVCISFSRLSATLGWARLLHPSLCCAPLPLRKCQMGVNMIQADSLRGPHRGPLLVLHLRAGLMLVGRVGSRLCEGLSPVTESKQGNSNSKLLRQQLYFLFLIWPAPPYIHFLVFFSVVLFCGCWFFSHWFQSELHF